MVLVTSFAFQNNAIPVIMISAYGQLTLLLRIPMPSINTATAISTVPISPQNIRLTWQIFNSVFVWNGNATPGTGIWVQVAPVPLEPELELEASQLNFNIIALPCTGMHKIKTIRNDNNIIRTISTLKKDYKFPCSFPAHIFSDHLN